MKKILDYTILILLFYLFLSIILTYIVIVILRIKNGKHIGHGKKNVGEFQFLGGLDGQLKFGS